MRNKIPLTVAIISLALVFSSCIRAGQSANAANNPTITPSPSNDSVKATPEPASEEAVLLKGPNALPKDTRLVVNIPAFRMDVFHDGTLLKSYKIGIGYQQFPLPTGFRKAE